MFVRLVTQVGNFIQRVEGFILSASILAIAGLTIINVLCRSLLGFSLAVAAELSQFCIIVVCFVGLSYAASKGRHIRMTAVYDQLPKRWQKVFMVIITACTSLILFTLACYAVSYLITVYELGGVSPVLRVPFYIVYAIAPLGLFLASVHYALSMFRNLTSDDVYLSFSKKDEYEEPVIQEI